MKSLPVCVHGPVVIPAKAGIQEGEAGMVNRLRSSPKPRNKRMSEKQPCVYLLASKKNGTLYTGVTSNLARRLYTHKHGPVEGFTGRYGVRRAGCTTNVMARWKRQSAGKSR